MSIYFKHKQIHVLKQINKNDDEESVVLNGKDVKGIHR